MATVTTALIGACSADSPASTPSTSTPATATAAATDAEVSQRFPDVLDAVLTATGDGIVDVTVTMSSPYDTPGRYADGWRVLAPDGTPLAVHTLAHDHAGEQPFTRTQSGVPIPDGVDRVTVEGRDQQYGYGGRTVTVDVPR